MTGCTGRDCGCGCCAGVLPSTPRPLGQRHGLPALAYRVGTHGDFLAGLVHALSDEDRPALARLRTRDPRDFTMALLDGVAAVCDVLTFNTERLAQESYLGTATDRASLRELARLVAYRLRPGVAAVTDLAFFVQPPPAAPAATGAPDEAFGGPAHLPDGVPVPVGVAVRSVPGPGEQPQTFETVEEIVARHEWNALRVWPERPTAFGVGEGARQAHLAGTGHRLSRGDTLLVTSSKPAVLRTVTEVVEDALANRTLVRWAPDLAASDVGTGATLSVFRKRVGLFGHNAPPRTPEADWLFTVSGAAKSVDLDGVHPDVVTDSTLALTTGGTTTLVAAGSVVELSRAAFGITGRVTRVGVGDADLTPFNGADLRATVVHAAPEVLPLADEPDPTALTGDIVVVEGVVDLPPGRRVIIAGTSTSGATAADVATVLRCSREEPRTRVFLTASLGQDFRRAGAVLYGNVARATHGETVHQVFGSGDGSVPHQRFELKHGPLTHVPSGDVSGVASTLVVRVDDVAWHEEPTLYGAGPGDRSFVTRETETGGVVVVFGDGERARRLPTGVNNVRAEYRRGIGAAGNLPPGAVSQVMDPPLGVTKATNPAPAVGGADPEPASAARERIPTYTRTLGRAVSVVDYADYARAYAGIAKADAAVLPLAGGAVVVVTVAAPGGAAVPEQTRSRLATSLRDHGDPTASVVVLPYRPAEFRCALRYRRHPDHRAAVVAAAVRAAVAAAFSFDARELGRPLHRSELITVVHRVAGVVAVDLDSLYRVRPPVPPEPGWPDDTVGLQARLLAARPRVHQGVPLATELLLAARDPFDHIEELP